LKKIVKEENQKMNDPLADFEVNAFAITEDERIESWLTLIHKPCGQELGEWDMIDLQTAIQLTIDHRCYGYLFRSDGDRWPKDDQGEHAWVGMDQIPHNVFSVEVGIPVEDDPTIETDPGPKRAGEDE
jgi:hypothetical protein